MKRINLEQLITVNRYTCDSVKFSFEGDLQDSAFSFSLLCISLIVLFSLQDRRLAIRFEISTEGPTISLTIVY